MSKEVKFQDGNLSQNIQELINCIENFSFIKLHKMMCKYQSKEKLSAYVFQYSITSRLDSRDFATQN